MKLKPEVSPTRLWLLFVFSTVRPNETFEERGACERTAAELLVKVSVEGVSMRSVNTGSEREEVEER